MRSLVEPVTPVGGEALFRKSFFRPTFSTQKRPPSIAPLRRTLSALDSRVSQQSRLYAQSRVARTGRNSVWLYVVCHDRSDTDNRPVTDRHAGEYGRADADPYIASDLDRTIRDGFKWFFDETYIESHLRSRIMMGMIGIPERQPRRERTVTSESNVADDLAVASTLIPWPIVMSPRTRQPPVMFTSRPIVMLPYTMESELIEASSAIDAIGPTSRVARSSLMIG